MQNLSHLSYREWTEDSQVIKHELKSYVYTEFTCVSNSISCDGPYTTTTGGVGKGKRNQQ